MSLFNTRNDFMCKSAHCFSLCQTRFVTISMKFVSSFNYLNNIFYYDYFFNFILVQHLPTITTVENCMKLSPMIVQACWEFKNPLLQLPHITEDHLKYFRSKKVNQLYLVIIFIISFSIYTLHLNL